MPWDDEIVVDDVQSGEIALVAMGFPELPATLESSAPARLAPIPSPHPAGIRESFDAESARVGDLDWLDSFEFGQGVGEGLDAPERDGLDPLLVDGDAPAFEWEPLASATPAQRHGDEDAARFLNPGDGLAGQFDTTGISADGVGAPLVPSDAVNEQQTSRMPALEPQTSRLSSAQEPPPVGDEASAGVTSRHGLIPAPTGGGVEPPPEMGENSEWSGWAALAAELHLGTDGPPTNRMPATSPALNSPLLPPPGTAGPANTEFRLRRDSDGPERAEFPDASDAFPSLPVRQSVSVARPTLPALPRIRGAVGLGSPSRMATTVPGLSVGLAAALARETSGLVEPSRAGDWGDDDDPWGGAELVPRGDDPKTLDPDARSTRGKLGLGLDEAVEAPEGWLQVLTSDLAPIRPSIRQTVLRSGRPVHVQEHNYNETTPAGVAAQVERLHGELVSRLRGQGLRGLRVAE